jgi:hypothetical protein
MTNSQKCSDYATGSEFQSRVRYLLLKASVAVMSEAPDTTNHTERLSFARRVLAGSASYVNVAIAVATNPTVAETIINNGEPTDNDLEFTVNSMFNAFSL